jgi:hypothetical protein
MKGLAGTDAPGQASVLLTWRGSFLPADSGTLLALDFEVPAGTGALSLRFGYTPTGSRDRDRNAEAVRACTNEYLKGSTFDVPGESDRIFAARDLDRSVRWIRNLFNVMVHDPAARSVGRWDLGMKDDPPAVWIAPDFASPGFAPTVPVPGRWTASVEIWEVFTDSAEAWLEVTAWPALPPEAHAAGSTRKTAFSPLPRAVPRSRIPGVLYGELHSHTVHSDGAWTVAQQAERAAAMGLDFVALTDHNVTSGHAEALEEGPVTRIRGIELTTFLGHFCLYGVDHHVPWYDRDRGVSILEAVDAERARGALASLAHPNNFGAPVCVGCRFQEGSVPYDRFDLMEVWYGPWVQRRVEIVKTLVLWDRLWDAGMRPVAIAARDWHGLHQEDSTGITFPVTAVRTDDRSEAGILSAIRAGRVFLTSGPALELTIRTASGSADIGDTVESAPGASLAIRLGVTRPRATPAIACLVRNGSIVAAWELPRRREASREWAMDTPGRYRVELWAADGELLALTNHIVVL